MSKALSPQVVEALLAFARLPLEGIQREYPNWLERRLTPPQTPRTIHRAFYGCFDWHSAVHGHWSLVRILRLIPDAPQKAAIRESLNANLTATNLLAETEYFQQPQNAAYERMYGWAWLLQLARELHAWDDPDGKKWARNLQPLVNVIVRRYKEYLPTLATPNRSGMHDNTAFGLGFALDYARTTGEADLEKLIIEQARHYYGDDTHYPDEGEPGVWDFLSPTLIELDLMSRILTPQELMERFERLRERMGTSRFGEAFTPVKVPSHDDPMVSHLDGLNFSRAWCLRRIATNMGGIHWLYPFLRVSAAYHAEESGDYIFSGTYMSTGHWLASFAIYFLTFEANEEL
jgi:hypothetical protein